MPLRVPRLLLLAAIAAAAVAGFPAPAGAQSVDEGSCRAQTAQPAACVGLAKLGERVSAECRRAGVADDETCWSRIGRRVVRGEIAEHEKSWLHRTLRFQFALGNSVPMRNAPWIGTHNSFNDTAEDPTLSHTDSNQQLGLRDQLRLDVRSLELDVHWIPSVRAGGAFAPVVCHGRGSNEAHFGCTTERLLDERLREVAGWVAENPGEVLLLYIEDHIGDTAGYAAAEAVVERAFGRLLYRPRGQGCRPLPLELTRDDVVAVGAQVIVVGSCGAGAWTALSHSWPASVRHEHRPRGYAPFPACGAPSAAEADAKIVRYFEDSTFVAPAGERLGISSTDEGLTPATVSAMVRCGVDIFGFDQLLPEDGRLPALAWSWAPGEPSRSGTVRCTVQRPDERWESAPCNRPAAQPACVAADGTWVVLAGLVSQAGATEACTAAGLVLGTPRTGRENALLREAAGEHPVWLAHRVSAAKPDKQKKAKAGGGRRRA